MKRDAVKRVASVIGIEPQDVARYEELHAEVWPAVLARLGASGVTNYSIYRYGGLLFSYLEYTGDDYEADMAAIAADRATRDWWAVCGPLQRPVPERVGGEWWHDIDEIFHLD